MCIIEKELREIEKNKVWELVERASKKPIYVKWVYKLKQRPNSEISKHKVGLVARGLKIGYWFRQSLCICCKVEENQDYCVENNIHRMKDTSIRCKVEISEWNIGRRGLCD